MSTTPDHPVRFPFWPIPILLLLPRIVLADSWPPSLYLANGGYWPDRVTVTIRNASAEPAAGEQVSLSLPALAGTPVESLRACRADGVELLYDLRDKGGQPKRTGELAADDQLIVPIECLPHAATTLQIYSGNAQAWGVPDFLTTKFTGRLRTDSGLSASIGPVEHLRLQPAKSLEPKTGPDWRNWAEVRVRRFTDQPAANALVRVNLRQALARLPGLAADCVARVAGSDGAELVSYNLGAGMDLLFTGSLPPLSESLFQVGFRPKSNRTRLEPSESPNHSNRPMNALNSLGAPPDALSQSQALHDYARLLAGGANLAPNGDFQRGREEPDVWRKPAADGPHRVTAGFSTDAKVGKRALELSVGENPKADWLGWYSPEIPVTPGATYLLSGWLKAVGLQSGAQIHAHFHNAQGALTRSGAMVGTQPAVSGDSDWIDSHCFFRAPPDAATIQIHLTINTQGTLRHDGILLCEVVDGSIARVHSGAPESARAGLQAWQVNPLVKVLPDTPPQAAARAVSVVLAGNEYQAFELALRAGTGTTRVSIAVSPLKRGAADELPPVKVERVGYVPVDYPSAYYSTEVPEWCRKIPQGSPSTDGWAGWWPDPLAPGTNLDLSADQTQPVWFTVHAPKQATPGKYQAQVVLSTASGNVLKIPLTVQVLPFTLPERGRLRAIFDLRFGPGGGFGGGIDSAAEFRLWLRFMAEHRLGIDHLRPEPKFSYDDGKVTMDAAGFDETAHYCFDELNMNVSYTPELFYMFGWAYPPKELFGLAPFTPEWNSALQQCYRLFTEHVRQKGWHDKFVYYISDEPHFDHDFVVEQMKKLCTLVHEVDATIPIYSSTWRHCAAWDNALDLWGIGQYGCFPVDEMARLQAAGKHMWFTCDGQMATDTPFLATERLLPYYCFRYGVTGFEFWGLAWWTYNPWQVGWHQFIRQSDEGKKYYWIRYPDGDGFLVYPGKPVGIDGPASTIRLEEIRQGLQDYEALTLLAEAEAKAKKVGHPSPAAERALAMARDLVTIPNAGGLRSTEILPEPDRVPAVRQALNAALVELNQYAR